MKRFLRHSCLSLFSLILLGPPEAPGAEAGELRGRVVVPPKSESPAPRRYFKGPYRSGHARKTADDGPRNVVIYLPDLQLEDAPRRPPAVMRQVNERFVPHVLPIQAGTRVQFPNEDDYYHNVFSVVSGDRFDLGRYAKGNRTSTPFDKAGVVVVRCEIHPRMKAYILVVETNAFTVPDDSGEFTIPGLPAGRHRVVAWHPDHGSWEGHAEVSAEATTPLIVSF